jgi:hypothetical protein
MIRTVWRRRPPAPTAGGVGGLLPAPASPCVPTVESRPPPHPAWITPPSACRRVRAFPLRPPTRVRQRPSHGVQTQWWVRAAGLASPTRLYGATLTTVRHAFDSRRCCCPRWIDCAHLCRRRRRTADRWLPFCCSARDIARRRRFTAVLVGPSRVLCAGTPARLRRSVQHAAGTADLSPSAVSTDEAGAAAGPHLTVGWSGGLTIGVPLQGLLHHERAAAQRAQRLTAVPLGAAHVAAWHTALAKVSQGSAEPASRVLWAQRPLVKSVCTLSCQLWRLRRGLACWCRCRCRYLCARRVAAALIRSRRRS